MDRLLLFTDGSVDTQLKHGYGAYLAINESERSIEANRSQVKVKRFTDTSSSKLELQTLIWALTDIKANRKIVVYTDSQSIIGLPGRRERLERNDYLSAKNKLLNNHELYREFYRVTDQLDYELIKVKGHLPSIQKDDTDRLFTLVDREARKALKNADNTDNNEQ